jgi:pimeloyl-ACP methyl ester carboxylesterase
VVKSFSDLGYDVLNIMRPGYGGTPTPTTPTPVKDSVPAFVDLIAKVYEEDSDGQGGIILIGHSLGGAISLIIAAEAGDTLPLLGVSSLGCTPSQLPLNILPNPDPQPENPRFVVEETAENIQKYMGGPAQLNLDALTKDVVSAVFEPGTSAGFTARSYIDNHRYQK